MILKVTYTMTRTEVIEWPDEELELLTRDNLECNLNLHDAVDVEIISAVNDADGQDVPVRE